MDNQTTRDDDKTGTRQGETATRSDDQNQARNQHSGGQTQGGQNQGGQNQGGQGGEGGGIADQARSVAQQAGEQVRSVAGSLTEQARSVASGTGQTATDLARRARDGMAGAGGSLYQQGSQAGQYIARGIDDYPVVALLVAGAIGYGLAYLIHNRWE